MAEAIFFESTFIIVFISVLLISVSARDLQNGAAPVSLSFPLTLSRHNLSRLHQYQSSLLADGSTVKSSSYKSSFKYTMALILSLPVGTPPQNQDMVLDTGSQLLWIHCHQKPAKRPLSSSVFDPALSSSFFALSCKHPVYKPRVPDFTLPTACDQSGLCHYSYFYADGTLAEGNLVWDKFAFSPSAVVLGCAAASGGAGDDKGMLGMNLGRLSFPTQGPLVNALRPPMENLAGEPTKLEPSFRWRGCTGEAVKLCSGESGFNFFFLNLGKRLTSNL